MKKILIWSPIKADATSFYRAWGPFQHLARTSDDIELIDISMPELEISWALLRQGDLLFMQRPSTDTESRIAEIARNCNIPIWIDYDDDYFNIPPTNPRHDLYGTIHRQEQIKRVVQYADVITVSTPAIKDSIIEVTGKNADKIHIIPNAVDETIFDLELPTEKEIADRDIIMWRGGDTHAADIEPYIDQIIRLYNEFPQYKWAFVGAAPDKLLKMVDTSRIQLYAWEDVFVYFDRLFDLKPRLTIVPWANTAFNTSKSNCSWLESTMVGAPTVFPGWSSEFVDGMIPYSSPISFYNAVQAGLNWPMQKILDSRISLELHTLYYVNSIRHSILLDLINTQVPKLGFRNQKYLEAMAPVDDKGFYSYVHEKLHIQENPAYREGHYNAGKILLEKYRPNSIVEIGCGPGPMLEYFLDKKVRQVVGFEINPHFKDYFVKRNPHYAANFHVVDISDVVLDGIFDLGISIEVFEHIAADKADALIARLAKHFRYFYFSSTPYYTSKQFDAFWGHGNLRTHEHWIKTFEERGWIYEGNPHLVTPWDLAFKSALVDNDVAVLEVGINEENILH